ncbi:hypothetical protein HHK36_009435 [Tetracentron sinense]|uniref:Exonuclease domain-containing protein n=1 Tax=Tetracentron sinense TaxID=13715 RepID=A0A835DI92_TETSI|nr:hypothetical protein HHK36_009435 [Tetracentron sinense]
MMMVVINENLNSRQRVVIVSFEKERLMEVPDSSSEGATEIVFFDLETTVPSRAGQRFWVLEFGAIVVCPKKLIEVESYCTLIRPGDLSAVAQKSGRCDGITRQTVATAPMFEEVAERIFSILNGRVWAGHNIRRFDCPRIKEAFSEVGRPAPVPVGMIDSLGVLTEKFGRRAGNMKESSLPDVLASRFQGSPTVITRSRSNGRLSGALASRLQDPQAITTRSRSNGRLSGVLASRFQGSNTLTTRSRSNGRLLCGEETSRKLHPTSIAHQRSVPYTRGRFRKIHLPLPSTARKTAAVEPQKERKMRITQLRGSLVSLGTNVHKWRMPDMIMQELFTICDVQDVPFNNRKEIRQTHA